MSVLSADRIWTFADLDELPDDGRRYELVDGNLVVTPPPTQQHQQRAGRLQEQLAAAAPDGWRVCKEFPLPLGDDLRQPDVAVYRWPPRHPRDDPRNPVGAPDVGLVVEVASPRTRKTDRFAKPGDYAEAGIALSWRLETEPDLVLHAFALRQDAYVPVAQVRTAGLVPVPWGELSVDLDAVDR